MKFPQRLLAAFFLLASSAFAQYTIAPYTPPQFFDASGAPLAGGLLYTYAAGTNTPQSAFSDSQGTAFSNPIILNAGGYPQDATGSTSPIFLLNNAGYKFCAADANSVQQWCVDNIKNYVIGSASDVIALWTGCDGTNYLRSDGTCALPSGAGNLFVNSPYLHAGAIPIAAGNWLTDPRTQQLIDGPLIQVPMDNSVLGTSLTYVSNGSGPTQGIFNLGSSSVAVTTYNASALAAVTAGKLYKLDAFNRAIPITTADTNLPAFIAVGNRTGTTTGLLALNGVAFCTFDNTNVTNDYVVASIVVAGDCHDTGVAPPLNPPTGKYVIGTVVANGVYISPYHNSTVVGLNDPGASGIVFRTTPNVTRIATSGDVSGLWTGCTSPGTQALFADGVCRETAGNVFTSGLTSTYIPMANAATGIANSVIQQVATDGTNFSYVQLHDESAHPSGILNLREKVPQGLTSESQLIDFTGLSSNQLVKINNTGGTGQWVKATTADTDVMVLPIQAVSSDTSGGGPTFGVQFTGIALIQDDGTPCTPGNVVVASTTLAGTIHDTGSPAPSGTEFVIGVCVSGSVIDRVLLTPSFN